MFFWTSVVTLTLVMNQSAIPSDQKKIEFLGFSANETIAAWRVEITRSHEDFVDNFALVRLTESNTNKTLGVFKDNKISRKNDRGKRIHVSLKQFGARNPDWQKAVPYRLWKKFKKMGKFRSKALTMNTSAFRVAKDRDTQVRFEQDVAYIRVRGNISSSVGFQPVLRLMNGRHISLGHFRKQGKAEQRVISEIRAYFSATGLHLALLNQYTIEDPEDIRQEFVGKTIELPEAVGTTAIGTLPTVYSSLRVAKNTFLDLHPNMLKDHPAFQKHWN